MLDLLEEFGLISWKQHRWTATGVWKLVAWRSIDHEFRLILQIIRKNKSMNGSEMV